MEAHSIVAGVHPDGLGGEVEGAVAPLVGCVDGAQVVQGLAETHRGRRWRRPGSGHRPAAAAGRPTTPAASTVGSVRLRLRRRRSTS